MTEAEAARIMAGLTLKQAAKRARLKPESLRRIELRGTNAFYTAERLADIYQCDIDLFCHPRQLGESGANDMPSPAAAGGDASNGASRRYRKPAQPILTLVD